MFAAILTSIYVLGFLYAKGDPTACESLCDLRRLLDAESTLNSTGDCARTVSLRPSFAEVDRCAFNLTGSRTVHLTAVVTLEGPDCPSNNDFAWTWTVYGESGAVAFGPHDDDGGPYAKIEGRDYPYGAYKVNVTLASEGREAPQVPGPSSQLRFEVLETPLAVRIAGGAFRTVPLGTVPEFDASGTRDPDGVVPAEDIWFRWFCPECGNYTLDYTGPKLRLDAYKDRSGANLTVQVVAVGSADGVRKTGRFTQIVRIVDGAAPGALMECLYNCGDPYASVDEKMVLRASFPGPVRGWEMPDWAVTLYDDGRVGSVAPATMLPSRRYIHCAFGKGPEGVGRACLTVRTAPEAPEVTCSVSPRKGLSLLTPFRVTCEGPDGLAYHAYQVLKDRGRTKGKLLRHGFERTMDRLLLFADDNEDDLETVVVNATDADYARVATVRLNVTVTPSDGTVCQEDLVDCVRALGLGDHSLLQELAARGRYQESLNLGRGLVRIAAKTAGDGRLPLQLQVALLRLLLRVPLWSLAGVEQLTGSLENVLRATWPHPPSEHVASLAMDVASRAAGVLEALASDRRRPIFGRIVHVCRLLLESLRGVFHRGPALAVTTGAIEDRLRDVTDAVARSVALHKFAGEAPTHILSTYVRLTVFVGPYSLLRDLDFGSIDGERTGFVRFGPKGLDDGDAVVTVHLAEYLARPVGAADDVTTHVMDLRVDGAAVGPVDYFLYVREDAVPPWLGPLPLRVKMPQDYTPDDVSGHKGAPGPDRPRPSEVAVLARADEPSTALEVKVAAGSKPGLGSFSPHETKPAPKDALSHWDREPAQYVTYVPRRLLLPPGTELHVGVLPFRNVSFRSYYHLETTTYRLAMVSLACRDLSSSANCSVVKGAFAGPGSLACRCEQGATRVGADVRAVALEKDLRTARLFLLIASNPSVLTLIGGVLLSYLALLAVAWGIDRNLRHKCGVTVPKDSDPSFKGHHYVAVVYTGCCCDAATSSRVAVRFNGRASRSQVHLLSDGDEGRFARGGEDRFLFATRRALGPVESVDVWTDPTGPNPAWLLHKIVLVDVARKDTRVFVANRWFGRPLEEDPDTLSSWALVPRTTERDKFRSLLAWRIVKGLQNDHLWLSVLFRWPASCFKCVHRATALLVTVLLAAFVNLSLGGLPEENATRPFEAARPAEALDESDLCSSFLCACVVVAVQLPFVQLLRRLWRCDKWEAKPDIDDSWPLHMAPAASRPQPQPRVEFVTVVVAEGNARTAYDLKVERPLPEPEPEDKEPEEGPQGAKAASDRALGHWVRGFTWVGLASLTLSLAGADVVYGLRMTEAETRVWGTRTALALALSFLVFEPLAVVAIAAIGAARGQEKLVPPDGWCADSVAQRAAAIESVGTLEEYARYLTRLRAEDPLYERPGPKVRRPRNVERRERVMVTLVAGIFSFVAFVVLLWVLVLDVREDLSFYSTATVARLAASGSFAATRHLGAEKVRDAKGLYRYLSDNLVPALLPDRLPPWTAAGSTLLLGAVRIRQIRSVTVTCPVRDADDGCVPDLSPAVEEKGRFAAGWTAAGGADGAWTYRNASEAPGMSASGLVTAVPRGGYATVLGPTREESLRTVRDLEARRWLDRRTRAVAVEFSTLGPFVNVLTVAQLVFEFPPTGGAAVSWFVDSFRPVRYLGYSRPRALFCYGFVVAFCAALAWREATKLARLGRFYFGDPWNLVNLSLVALSYAYLAFNSSGASSLAPGSDYLDPSSVVSDNRWGTGALALLVTASTAKLWKLLSFNRHMYGFVLTLRYCAAPLAAILLPFLLVYAAFASYVHVLFADSDRDARTFGSALAQMFFATIAEVRFGARNDRGPVTARFARMAFFALFLFVVFVYMVTMFMSIILRSFKKGSARKGLMRNRYEVLNFVSAKAFAALGKGRPRAYRQCLDAVRESHLAELTVGRDRAERLADVVRQRARALVRVRRRRLTLISSKRHRFD